MKPLTPHEGRGKELKELLMKELSIPENARWFEVRFEVDKPVLVTYQVMPRERE